MYKSLIQKLISVWVVLCILGWGSLIYMYTQGIALFESPSDRHPVILALMLLASGLGITALLAAFGLENVLPRSPECMLVWPGTTVWLVTARFGASTSRLCSVPFMESGGVIPILCESDRKKSLRPLVSIRTLMCRIEEAN